MGRPRTAGFTLLEAMVVLAVLGILATLSLTTLARMQPRVDVGSALDDLLATVAQAQARAQSQGGDVWVIFHPTGPGTSVRARGGVLVYEDPDRDFDFRAFSLQENARPSSALEAGDRVASETWYGREPYLGRVRLALEQGEGFDLQAPFSGAAVACGFCSDSLHGFRGALVFQADGEVRIVDGNGVPLSHLTAGVVTLSSDSSRGALAIAPTTGFARVTRP